MLRPRKFYGQIEPALESDGGDIGTLRLTAAAYYQNQEICLQPAHQYGLGQLYRNAPTVARLEPCQEHDWTEAAGVKFCQVCGVCEVQA